MAGNQSITQNRLRIFTQPIFNKLLIISDVRATALPPQQHTKA
jgi:hypothetical protein